jgi:heavy-metal-associated domain-containing protein
MSEGNALVSIASYSPGRLRLKLPPEIDILPNLDQFLRIPAITEVSYRKLTGSLLLQYDETRSSLQEILLLLHQYLPSLDIKNIPPHAFEHELPKNHFSSVMYHYSDLTNQAVHQATSGLADLTSILPIAFFAWAAIDLVARPSLPRWFELYREGSYLWHFYQNVSYGEKGR